MYRTYRVELNGCPVAWRVYTDFAQSAPGLPEVPIG